MTDRRRPHPALVPRPAPGRIARGWPACAILMLVAGPAPAATPDARTRDALDTLVLGQVAAKACPNLRIDFRAMVGVAAAAGLQASDTTRLYGQTVGELGEQYTKAAAGDLGAFCNGAWAALGTAGSRAHMLQRTDGAQ